MARSPDLLAVYVASQVCFLCVASVNSDGVSSLLQPYDFLYYSGVRSYFNGEWTKAAELLERSITTKEAIFEVRRKCYDECGATGEDALQKLSTEDGNLWDLWALDWVQKKAECLRFCVGRSVCRVGQLPVSTDIEFEFGSRNPYNFLQVTYYKLEKPQKAAAAAQTYFVANPTHLEMRNNIEKYRRMAGVNDEDFYDRERDSEKHWLLYDSALQLEASSEWAPAVDKWRACVNETLRQTEECRVQCEVAGQRLPEDRGVDSNDGVFEKAAALSLSLLSCQQSCVTQVATRPGRISSQDDFLPTQLEHMHIAQFKAGDVKGATQTLRSLLLFYPSDKDSMDNLQLYQETLGGDKESDETQATQEIVRYVKRSLREKKLLYFGMENLNYTFTDPDLWTPEDIVPESLREIWKAEKEKMTEKSKEEEQQEEVDDSGFYAGGPVRQVGVTITMDDLLLNGTNRVVLDGVTTEKECDRMLKLASAVASAGDGYRGRRSPHTPHETLNGLTLFRAVKLADDGLVNVSDAKLLYELGERARNLLHSYFRSPSGLFVTFTHLVCRSAVAGDQEGRMDLSHPVHVDNCLLEPDTKQCWKEPPAFINRDLSAVLYLNDDFDGGEFFFTNRDAKTVTARVKPTCGRLVGFSSGPINPHGVTAVTRGRRCALALWFTKEKLYRDMEREEVENRWAPDGQGVADKSDQKEGGGGAPATRNARNQAPAKGKARGRVTVGKDEL
ncbi:prolyl 3-hydroxylase 3 [Corythoichthys intestinalis]|uniref:prolyl 3-hydroxylase 3 n=1 Tax=Corythoichthys intestinalis TaxID=161448 RepID=UPI0025A4DE0F|nr:prolyl 3-hydroxylase 3 [Corythoichthys intestinalis]XP_061789507.1 prolyl 3-hydroxylase 3-like [Nerophis lumbriciformis]